jgi:glyoxylase-like metal-dependent hydrolase (beta-lactamase superfamily II)
MEVLRLPVGLYQANAYVLKNDLDVLIVDPGARADKIKFAIGEQEKVLGILLTHGHFDHISAVDELVSAYGCPVYVHSEDKDLLRSPERNYSQTKKVKLTSTITVFPDNLVLGSFDINILHAPGHTAGSVLFKIENHLFTGDVLFCGSIGRTDLYSGNDQDMKRSLKMIRSIHDNLIVHPGHEQETTLFQELRSNPYLQ